MLYQESFHLYDYASGYFMLSSPLRRTSFTEKDGGLLVYLNDSYQQYLRIPAAHPELQRVRSALQSQSDHWWRKVLRYRLPLFAGLFVAGLALLYLMLILLVPFVGLRVIGPREEQAIGKRFHSAFVSTSRIHAPATAAAQRFADAMELSKVYPIRITVVNDTVVNAFALPGGYVVVNTGLLQRLPSAASFAALLGHEVSHVNHRHSLRSLLRSAAAGLMISVLLGDAGGVVGVLVQNADNLQQLSYSRDLEREADREGMQLLVQNGLPASGMAELLNTLQQAYPSENARLSLLSTHPLTAERIRDANRLAGELRPADRSITGLQTLWQALKRHTGTQREDW